MDDRGILEQLRDARHPIAAPVGALLGGFVPLATYTVAHDELIQRAVAQASLAQHFQRATGLDPGWAIVAGGLLYSAKTVWQWADLAFDCRWKATGFVMLLEGVMVFSGVAWLARTALVYLMAINAAATASKVAKGVRRRPTAQSPSETPAPAQCTTGVPSHNSLPFERPTLPALASTEKSGGHAARSASRSKRARQSSDDVVYERAREQVRRTGACSISAVQRDLNVGHGRASRIVARLVEEGIVGAPRPDGRRAVVSRSAPTPPPPLALLPHPTAPMNGSSAV